MTEYRKASNSFVKRVRAKSSDWFGRDYFGEIFSGVVFIIRERKKNVLSLYAISNDIWENVQKLMELNLQLESLGIWVGEIREENFNPSLELVQLIAPHIRGRTMYLTERGSQIFVYGHNILAQSVKRVTRDVNANDIVLVRSNDKLPIGMAKVFENPKKLRKMKKDDVFAQNLLDIGWYLRRGG